jgi:ribonuclease P protein component
VDELPGRARPARRESGGNPNKLVRPDEFRAALTAVCRLSGKGFLVRALLNARTTARLGLIASRKAAPRAVDRNRGKRLAREAFRAVRPQLPAVDIVFQQKNNLRQLSNPSIRSELDRLLREVAARFGGSDPVVPGACANPKTA